MTTLHKVCDEIKKELFKEYGMYADPRGEHSEFFTYNGLKVTVSWSDSRCRIIDMFSIHLVDYRTSEESSNWLGEFDVRNISDMAKMVHTQAVMNAL